jgi:hypothetical protein
MSRDQHPPSHDVTSDTENTASSVVACWTVFTELLLGNVLIKSVFLWETRENISFDKKNRSGDFDGFASTNNNKTAIFLIMIL